MYIDITYWMIQYPQRKMNVSNEENIKIIMRKININWIGNPVIMALSWICSLRKHIVIFIYIDSHIYALSNYLFEKRYTTKYNKNIKIYQLKWNLWMQIYTLISTIIANQQLKDSHQ